jgi:hypothetical protein
MPYQYKPHYVTCDECGEQFWMYCEEHAYKLYDSKHASYVRFCSWHCLRAYEKKLEKRRQRKPYITKRGI